MKNSIFKKICAVSLSALMLVGTGAAEAGSFIGASLPVYAAGVTPASDFEYETKSDDTITITGFNGTQTDVVIPETIDGKNVTVIGPAFEYNTTIKSVTIPNGITQINSFTFSNCSNLSSVTLPDSITYIGECAFENCENLTSINIPDSVTEIDNCAFFSCKKLINVNIPDSVDRIGDSAFSNTAWLDSQLDGDVYAGNNYYKYIGKMPDNTSITIKDGTKCITDNAFNNFTGNCSGLISVSIPDSVTNLGQWAFYYCNNLTSVNISRSIQYIRERTFEGCKKLERIVIPNGVTYIGHYSFEGCENLKSITIPESVKEIDKDAFFNCDKLKIVCIKGSYAEQYAIENNIPYKSITAPLKNTSTLSAKKVALGGKIKINLSAAGGIAPYKYSVLYKKSTGTKWATLAANTTKTSVSFTPKAAVTYDLKITAKDSAGKTSSKTVTVTVTKHLTNISKLGAETAKVGEKVKVRCYAQGGTGGYTYAVYYKKSAGAKWSKLRGYKSANIVLLTPKAATSYDVRVLAKDSSGKVVEKILKLTATK